MAVKSRDPGASSLALSLALCGFGQVAYPLCASVLQLRSGTLIVPNLGDTGRIKWFIYIKFWQRACHVVSDI